MDYMAALSKANFGAHGYAASFVLSGDGIRLVFATYIYADIHSSYIHTHTHTHTHTHSLNHTSTHTFIHSLFHTPTNTNKFISTHIYTHLHTFTHTCIIQYLTVNGRPDYRLLPGSKLSGNACTNYVRDF